MDVLSVSMGFVLRVWAGALIIDVQASAWLLVMVLLLSLFIVLIKRMAELLALGEKAPLHRKVLSRYSVDILNRVINLFALLTIAVYAAYTIFAAKSPLLTLTIPFAAFGIYRYLNLIHREQGKLDLEDLFVKDIPFLASIFFWGINTFVFLYLI